jgi:hypothetical protein
MTARKSSLHPSLRYSAAELVPLHLDDPHVRLAENIAPDLLDALAARLGVGADHVAGERLLAWIRDQDGQVETGALLTTHRVVVLTEQRVLHIPFVDLRAVDVDAGVSSTTVTARRGSQGEARWSGPHSARLLAGIMEDLLQLPANERVPPTRFLLPPQAVDPTGAAEARSMMRGMEPRLDALLRLIPASVTAGIHETKAAYHLSCSVLLLERTLFEGRGQAGSAWLSCLDAGDLLSVLMGLLGGAETRQEDGAVLVEWEMGSRVNDALKAAGSAIAAQAMASAMAAVLGFGVGVGPRVNNSLKRIAVRVRSLPLGSAFELLGARDGKLAPLAYVDAEQTHRLFAWLRKVEPEVCLQRILSGRQAAIRPPDAAMWFELERQAQRLVPGLSIQCFEQQPTLLPLARNANPAFVPENIGETKDKPTVGLQRPRVRAGEVPPFELQRRTVGKIQLFSGFVNLIVPVVDMVVVGLIGKTIEDQTKIDAAPIAVLAVLPLSLFGLAFLEMGVGALGIWKRGKVVYLAMAVGVLEVLSGCVGGLLSMPLGLVSLFLLWRARQAEQSTLSEHLNQAESGHANRNPN